MLMSFATRQRGWKLIHPLKHSTFIRYVHNLHIVHYLCTVVYRLHFSTTHIQYYCYLHVSLFIAMYQNYYTILYSSIYSSTIYLFIYLCTQHTFYLCILCFTCLLYSLLCNLWCYNTFKSKFNHWDRLQFTIWICITCAVQLYLAFHWFETFDP